MKSGALLIEYPVVSTKLNRPPPEPGASTKLFPVVLTELVAMLFVVTEENPRPPIVAWGPSTDNPKANLPPKSLTTRKPYCRAQLKPTLYCGSMVRGGVSVRFSIPFLFSVSKDHCCPPVKVQPLLRAACP